MKEYIKIILLFVLLAELAAGDEPGEQANENQDTCKKIGPQCSTDGTFVNLCTHSGEKPSDRINCNTNEMCKEEKDFVGCVPIGSNTRAEFICEDIGEFPDPFNCSRTFLCKEKNGKPSEVCSCPENSTVSPTPDLFCLPGDCTWKDITCNGRDGAFEFFTTKDEQKTSLCYYCRSSTAVNVFKNCETPHQNPYAPRADRSVDGKKCESYDLIYKKNANATTGSTTNTTSQTIIYVSAIDNEEPVCKNAGDLHKTECDCDFYKCNSSLKPVRKSCLDGMVFKEKYNKCFFGDCDPSKCTGRPKP